DAGIPQFEGSLQLTRPSPDGIAEPWTLSTHVKGDATAASLDQLELQFGSEDRGVRLGGSAGLVFGRAPELVADLAATQLDLDRVFDLPDAVRRRSLTAMKAALEKTVAAPPLPIPCKLTLRVASVTLAGTSLQRLRTEIRSDGNAYGIERLEFRAPGSADISLRGQLEATGGGLAFAG